MNKYRAFYTLLFIFFFNSAYANHSPSNDRGLTKELNIRSFFKVTDALTAIATLAGRDSSFDEQQRSLTIGGRYSLSDNVKLGLFSGYVVAQKHNDNWIRENGIWKWNNYDNKNEFIFYPELSYRNLVENLMYEIKFKYVVSNLFDEKDFFTKVSLMYNLSPLWNVGVSDEVKLSFQNKEKTLSENWIYLSSFYKFNNHVLAGPLIGYFKRFWTTSAFHKSIRTDLYQSDDSSVSLGLNVNFYF